MPQGVCDNIGLSKYIFQKLNKPNTLKNWEITRKMWVKNLLACLSFKPKAKSTSLDVRSEIDLDGDALI
jgi:hypothetical protein